MCGHPTPRIKIIQAASDCKKFFMGSDRKILSTDIYRFAFIHSEKLH